MDQINKAKNNENDMLLLIQMFYPLLKKYAGLLKDEDSFPALQANFIELIFKMDTKTISNKEDSAILAYIKHAMYHYYIFLSKKTRIYKRYNILESALSYDNENIFENLIVYNDDHSSLIWKDIRSYLTNKEFIILYHLLVLGENGQDVAKQMGITRQAVYNLKKSALNKLRKKFSI